MRRLPKGLSPLQPAVLVATWFLSGLSPKAPGTLGSLAALPFAWGLLMVGGWPLLAAASVVVFVIGLWATGVYIQAGPDKDPGSVVVDEVAGQWIALLPATLSPMAFLVGFALFRFFDILKPWPISWSERRFGGAFGVMIDDVLAGAFAAVGVLVFLRYAPEGLT